MSEPRPSGLYIPEIRIRQNCLVQECVGQFRRPSANRCQVRVPKLRSTETGISEVGAGEVGLKELGAVEIGVGWRWIGLSGGGPPG